MNPQTRPEGDEEDPEKHEENNQYTNAQHDHKNYVLIANRTCEKQ